MSSKDASGSSGRIGRGAAGLDDPLTEALVGTRRFFTRSEVSDDHALDPRDRRARGRRVLPRPVEPRQGRALHPRRQLHRARARGRSTSRTASSPGSRSRPTTRRSAPDRPEYEPRGCPRGAAFSWYTYSPTRVRYPYVRGVLLEMYREAKAPSAATRCVAWADDRRTTPRRPRRYKSARGKGGLVRATWDEAVEIVAAAHVYTIKRWGPDRVAGFSPIPAMSMVSHASGARFLDADRRLDAVVLRLVRRPAGRLAAGVRRPDRRARVRRLVGRRLPDHVGLERAGDPHARRALDDRGALPRPEGRRGLARLRRQRQVRRRVARRRSPAPTAPWRWRWATSSSRSSSSTGRSPFFTDYVKKYTDLPFLVAPRARARTAAATAPGKFLTAADLDGDAGRRRERRCSRRCCSTRAPASRWCRNGSLGFRFGDEGVGQVEPRPRRRRPAAHPARHGHRDARRGRAAALRRPRRHGRARCAAACRCAGSAAAWSPPSST